ncbi:MAG: DUF3084 domain-containing protein [Phormidesmis sp.]
MTGFVLLFAVACLGGVIATVGDRIGMKVGKSRLSLFNLRPRQTATLVSVATGMVASFSTLMLMIALDSQLRKGLFQLDEIQADLSTAQQDLEATQAEKDEAESTLKESIERQQAAQSKLSKTNESLQTAIAREEETLNNLLETQSQLSSVSEQALSLRDEINDLRSERQALIEQQSKVRSQIAQRDQDIAERDQELAQRNAQLSDRDSQIAQRDQDIAERESRLEELQSQQRFLADQIAQLEEEFQSLRLGNVAIGRNQTLAFTIARADSEAAARLAVEDALLKANRFAVQTLLQSTSEIDQFAIRFDAATAAQIVRTITDQQNYVIKVSSAANYVIGEPCVEEALAQKGEPCLAVNLEAVINEVLFQPGDVFVSAPITTDDFAQGTLSDRFRKLRDDARSKSRRLGIIQFQPIMTRGLSDPVLDFFRRVQAVGEPLEIQAFASQPVFVTGPVFLELAAVKNGQVLFTTLEDGP